MPIDHRPTSTHRALAAFVSVCVLGSSLSFYSCQRRPQRAARQDQLENKSIELAGLNGLNCGWVRLQSDATAANDCATNALAQNRPFRVRYDVQGIDSYLAFAIVRTPDGKLYELFYDGDVSGGSAHIARLETAACPERATLVWDRNYGHPTCFANDKQRRLAYSTILKNQQIIEMIQTGFDDSYIVAKIKGSTCLFDTSPAAVAALKRAGASATIVEAVVKAKKAETFVIRVPRPKTEQAPSP